METLVLGRPSAERERLQQLLVDAGMRVNMCHAGDWGCVGMDDDCPIDLRSVDVAVAVAELGDRFDTQGIACTHRARIPIVTIGATASDPVLKYVRSSLPRVDERVIDAVEAAASDAEDHQRAVEEALATRVAADEDVRVRAERRSNSIQVVLFADVATDRAGVIADWARAAVRSFDPHVSVIDVSVTAPPETTDDD